MGNTNKLVEASKPRIISFVYTNYKGETSVRTVTPFGIYWGTTQWYPEPGWLLQALDHEKEAKREFALKDCDFTRTTLPEHPG